MGKCLSGEMSVRETVRRGTVSRGSVLGEVSVTEMSSRGNVRIPLLSCLHVQIYSTFSLTHILLTQKILTLKINVIILFTRQAQEKLIEKLRVDQLCFLCHISPLHFI